MIPTAFPQPNGQPFAEVLELLARYYDGLYRGSSADLSGVFHPSAHYYSATGGELLHLDMDQYFPIVDERESPESAGEDYHYRVESIEFAGPVSAFARLHCRMLQRDYTDLLTLLHVDGRWQIVAKVFHFEGA